MENLAKFDRYIEYLCAALEHKDRNAGLQDYCRGLMLPIHRKSVEPLAAHTDPLHVSAKHQSLHHFVAKAGWSDSAVMTRIRDWVVPHLGLDSGCYWIVDDTGVPKKGTHSVGVARQYRGQLGKQDNCQVAVSLSLASVPVGYQLYLPKDWATDPVRRKNAGVPDGVTFATKPEIALAQMHEALASGMPMGVVLADAGYGDETAFRSGITELGLLYAVGIRPATTVWAPGTAPLPPKPWSGRGIRPTKLRREPGHEPMSVKALAMELPQEAYSTLTWREGTNTDLSSCFAAVRVRSAHRDYLGTEMRPEEWLLIEWPEGEAEPVKYFLSTAPSDATLEQLVFVTKMRWRIEQDYQELKQEFGLAHYEGRGWRGFHHHATLCIAAYAFLVTERLSQDAAKKNRARPEASSLPENYIPRGSPASPATRA
ncbi:IS701 family transposase [Caballeronia sordidicola]|jgi:SRSO17 transposase|uniref:Mobile element protein n=1 Tax=Caballeronia sordidicola TaxID=196367 RepID=A0A226XBQ5_CABSO|nr:IS701 family transposase [Caballeronia sordidicola]OXC80440.1 Mobile element protein [Caballeronia sordidicola]